MTDMDFYQGFIAGFQEDPTSITSECILSFFEYKERFRAIIDVTASNISYSTGRTSKGSGTPTVVGFYMEKITMYMDIPVMVTNTYNHCSIDYFFEKFGKICTSLSGALDLLTNFFWRFFGTEDA